MEVCREQSTAGGVPVGVGRAGLGEHRPEDDDVVGCESGRQCSVGDATADDPLQDVVDLGADGRGGRRGEGRSAVQGEDELVPLTDGRVHETLHTVGRGDTVTLRLAGIGEHLLERSVGQVVQEVFPSREVPVEGADADSSVGGDRGHGDSQPFTMYRCRCRADEFLLVAQRVTAQVARGGVRGGFAAHRFIQRPPFVVGT